MVAASDEAGELCSKCAQGMETGVSEPEPHLDVPRPLGITILAILNYAFAALYFGFAIKAFFAPKLHVPGISYFYLLASMVDFSSRVACGILKIGPGYSL